MTKRRSIAAVLVLAGLAAQGFAQDRAEQIIDRIVEGEQQFLKQMSDLHPFLETYIQEMNEGGTGPARDHYMLMRLDAGKNVDETRIAASESFRKTISFPFRNSGKLTFNAAGWARMAFLDSKFDRTTYRFDYSRREFLGEVRCLVFEVSPAKREDNNRFIGNIWVDDREFRVVRFNGTFTQSKRKTLFFHFDSWRVNVAPATWVPAFIYVEEGNGPAKAATASRLKAQVRLWGYNIRRTGKLDELAEILIDSKTPVEDRAAKDVSPVESQRAWERQAEMNVIDKLERSGLLAPKGEVDRVLNTVVNNLAVTNKIDMEVQCRVVLTTPLETFSIGKTIVISRGLLDVLPDEASLAMVLSGELAHIALGHRTPTAFAFGDQTMFNEREILDKLNLSRTPEEIAEAGKKSVEILSNSPYKDKLGNAGLFLKAVSSRMPLLPHLVQANMGNAFAGPHMMEHLGALSQKAPELDAKKMDQIAALPLGSRVKVNVWTNQISLVKTEPVAFVSEREKMPFEVTPVMLHLARVGSGGSPEAQGAK